MEFSAKKGEPLLVWQCVVVASYQVWVVNTTGGVISFAEHRAGYPLEIRSWQQAKIREYARMAVR